MSVIIRLQNLPWNASALDIRQFFYGLAIPDGGVHIIGGDKGDAFIAFSTDEDARRAMMYDRGKINDLPIRLLLSSKTEMQNVILTARSAPQHPLGPVSKEPFGRPSAQEGFGSNASGPGSGGYDFPGQRNRDGPQGDFFPPSFASGADKRDYRPMGLGQSNSGLQFPGRQDFGAAGVIGGEVRPGSDIGLRPPLDRTAFGNRPPFDVRSAQDSKHMSLDTLGDIGSRGGPGPVSAFGGAPDHLMGGLKGGPFGQPNSQGPAGGSWGFPPVSRGAGFPRDGSGGGFGDHTILNQEHNMEKDFMKGNVGNRDLRGRMHGEEFSDKGRLAGNLESARFARPELGGEFGRPAEGFGRQEFNREFRKFPDQPTGIGRAEPGREFVQRGGGNEFLPRLPVLESRVSEGRRDFGHPSHVGHEFRMQPDATSGEGGFQKGPIENDVRDFGRLAGGDFLHPPAVGSRDFMTGDGGRPGFTRSDTAMDFARSDSGREFSQPGLRNDFARKDEGRLGGQFARSEFLQPEDVLGREFGREGPSDVRLGARNLDSKFPRDNIPYPRRNREDSSGFGIDPVSSFSSKPGFGGLVERGPGLGTGPIGMHGGDVGRPALLSDSWRDGQQDRDMLAFPGRHVTPPKLLLDRFTGGGGIGAVRRFDEKGFGNGGGGRERFVDGTVVRVSNLPLSYNYREVRRFFVGCEVPPDGLKMVNDRFGKRTGIAYVKFSSPRNSAAALKSDGRLAENCRVVVERCSDAEYEDAVDGYKPPRGGPLDSRDRSRSPLRRHASSERDDKFCVVVKKLSPRTTESDVRAYFSKSCIAKNGGPYIEVESDGYPTGCALIEFDSMRDYNEARFISKHHKLLNGAEIRVIGISKSEFDDRVRKAKLGRPEKDGSHEKPGSSNMEDSKLDKKPENDKPKVPETTESVVKGEKTDSAEAKPCCVELQGVPWTTTIATIRDFFKGLNIVENGVHVILNREGRAVGSVFVEFANPVDCMKALEKNKQYIGKRYINVVLVGKKQMLAEISKKKVMPGGSASGHAPSAPAVSGAVAQAPSRPSETGEKAEEATVSLKSLNFKTQLEDILEFFHGYHPIVDSIKLQYKDGKPTGDGLITFPSLEEARDVVRLLNRKMLLGRQVLLSIWP